MTTSHFTYDAMAGVLDLIGIALDDRPSSLGLRLDGDVFNQNGIPALRVRDSKGRAFVITALPEES